MPVASNPRVCTRNAPACGAAHSVATTARARHANASPVASIPPAQRTMIVFHNAFDYYARRFPAVIQRWMAPTAGAEPNPAHIADLVRLARTEHVAAVFAEHEYSDKLALTLAASAGGLKVAFLYDDSLGTGPPVNTYIGMIDTDSDTIASALR